VGVTINSRNMAKYGRRYSNKQLVIWLNSINKYHSDDEVKEEATHLIKLIHKGSSRGTKHMEYAETFIDENKLETIKNTPIKI
jgi:hypothetical protein